MRFAAIWRLLPILHSPGYGGMFRGGTAGRIYGPPSFASLDEYIDALQNEAR